jgi:two-component system OmpR family sensor kinase
LPGLRSLRNRLAVAFGLIVLGAIGTIYLSTTPRLQDRLRNQRLVALSKDAVDAARTINSTLRNSPKFGGPLPAKPRDEAVAKVLEFTVHTQAANAGAEILVLRPLKGTPGVLTLIIDSTPDGGVNATDVQSVALEALQRKRAAMATEATSIGHEALAAVPLARNRGVVVLSNSLEDVASNVSLIRRQILYSGAVALAIALLAGYLVARALSLRVKRLEQAARKVASGDFSNPIRSDSDDELGQLAAAFDDMQNQLARLDRARKQFIASASHELRTPIFSLGGFLELLADEDLDEETRRTFLEQLRGQVDRMRMLATELLDLSRLESGALELHTEPTDVGELAREVAAEFTPAAQRHETDVKLHLTREPIEVECDPERVAQVLRILLDNALVHTPNGTSVRVSAARHNGHVRLEVSDRGLGIKRQNMPHIFEPFFSSDDDAQGAGLGLAIARELAERMQGQLTVRSIPGATTFSLELPG